MDDTQERPAPSPAKLLGQFNDWVEETEMPGRTMSYLKTGFLPEVLAQHVADSGADDGTDSVAAPDSVATMLDSWDGWEKGNTRPEVVLAVLKDNGLVELLTELSS